MKNLFNGFSSLAVQPAEKPRAVLHLHHRVVTILLYKMCHHTHSSPSFQPDLKQHPWFFIIRYVN